MRGARNAPPVSRQTQMKTHAFPSPDQVLRVFEAHPEKIFRLRDLVQALGLTSSQARPLKSALKELARERKILRLKKSHFALMRRMGARNGIAQGLLDRSPGAANIAAGRLIGHRDGYGFVVPDARPGEQMPDIFIPPHAMHGAMHGDRVEVQVFRAKPPRSQGRFAARPQKSQRFEGTILRVLQREQKTVVGEFRHNPRADAVLPFDARLGREILIPRGAECGANPSARDRQFGREAGSLTPRGGRKAADLDGLIVEVEITSFPTRTSPAEGRVIEVLGERDAFGVDVEIMIRKFHLPHRFPPEALAAASHTPREVGEADLAGRRDFRALPIVTIDGETAKDFDDAVYVERLPGGRYLLQVHIADVAHYVRPGAVIDREARLRGTSVYFPDRAVPMLPLDLSNGICSLNPHVDRLVMSALMEIDADGKTAACRLTSGVIRSAQRMTYTAVHAVLSGDEAACREYAAHAEQFKLMEELAVLLSRRREARGSIDFDLPEPAIEFDEHGRMTGVTRSERNIAHRIIEEFMLAANEAVAAHLDRLNLPTLYRVHEKPDPAKVIEFEEIAATFGYSLGAELPAARRLRVRSPRFTGRHAHGSADRAPLRFEHLPEDIKITSCHYQRLTQRIAGKPEERILSYLMLRSLKQARYSEENLGHFALASPTYTHFTSPIRRYPDLIVHRILKAALGPEGGARLSPDDLHALGLETSETERRAAEAERELMDWKKVTFMASRVGDEFEALIISLTKHGFFVELIDLFVEGFVPVESFGDPRWVYRESRRALVHRDSRRAFHLGGRVAVRLDRIDREGNKLIFSVVL